MFCSSKVDLPARNHFCCFHRGLTAGAADVTVLAISASAALRAAVYRVVRGGSEHCRTIEALEFSIDPEKKLIPALDKLRKTVFGKKWKSGFARNTRNFLTAYEVVYCPSEAVKFVNP